jgi:hypothetical protein
MATSLTPRDLTQVAIQPSASPVNLNVTPAPGQQLRGNSLQQLGEALSGFSPSLQGMLARAAEEDKRNLAIQGASVDFSQVDLNVDPNATPEERQFALNRAFKEAVVKNNAPDSANPFFLMEARKNFGRSGGLQYRNALASLSASATDPANPVPFSEIAKQAAEKVGMDAFTSDIYGAAGFASVAQEANAEFSSKFQAEMLKRQEFVAVEQTQNGIAEALRTAGASGYEWDSKGSVGVAMQQMVDSIHLTTTDPLIARKVLLGGFETAISQTKDEAEVETMMSAMGKLSFGKAQINQNPAFYSNLLTIKDQRLNEIAAEATRNERVFDQNIQQGVRGLYALGWNEKVSAAIMAGNAEQAQQITEKLLDEYVTKNPDMKPDVRDGLRSAIQLKLSPLFAAVGVQRNAASDAETRDIMDAIDDGSIPDRGLLRDRMTKLPIQSQMMLDRHWQENIGVVRGATTAYVQQNGKGITAKILQSYVDADMATGRNASGQPMLPPSKMDEANDLETEWRAGANERVKAFVRGDVLDATSGMTYRDLKAASGVEVANRAVVGILDGYYDGRVKEQNQAMRGVKSATEAGIVVGKPKVIEPRQAFIEEVAMEQKMSVTNAFAVAKGAGISIEAQSEGFVTSLQSEIAQINQVALDMNLGAVYNTDKLLQRLGDMWSTAQKEGKVGVVRRGVLFNTNREYTPDLVLQQYGRVKRSMTAGLSAQEVIANQTSDGVPVFGVVLPNKEAAVDYAFTVPMFKNELELMSPLTTNKVMDALGLSAQVREAFVARQAELIRYKRQLLIKNPSLTK